jgi:hypothetical protein
MTKAANSASLISADVLQHMIPGERYTLHEIMTRLGVGISSARSLLAGPILEGRIKSGYEGRRNVYWRPTEEEAGPERKTAERPQQTPAILTGYDASIRRIQELSMRARPRPLGERET